MVGKTIVGMRVDDTLRALDWLMSRRDVDPARVTVYGAGLSGRWRSTRHARFAHQTGGARKHVSSYR